MSYKLIISRFICENSLIIQHIKILLIYICFKKKKVYILLEINYKVDLKPVIINVIGVTKTGIYPKGGLGGLSVT